jgi:hypothetical protein
MGKKLGYGLIKLILTKFMALPILCLRVRQREKIKMMF